MRVRLTVTVMAVTLAAVPAFAQDADPKLDAYKKEAARGVDEMAKIAQEMVDSVFSFGELGFQEVETSKYLTGQLEKFGFKVQRGVAGIPTAWVATWGSGQAGDRAGLGHRRHPAGVAEAGRRLSRSDHRRRARPRRRAQHRHAAEHRRRARGEADHGARQAAGHADALAGRRRGAASAPRRGTSATACSRTWTWCCSRTSATTSACRGATAAAPAWCRWSTPSQGETAHWPARPGAAARRSTPWS